MRSRALVPYAMVRAITLALTAVLALSVSSFLVACGPKPAAVVNGHKIPMSQVNAEIDSMKKEHPQVFEGENGKRMEEQFRKRIVDNLVANLLVAQEAESQGVTVSAAEVERKLASMEKQFHSKEQFQQALARSGTTLEALRERIRLQLLTARMVEKVTANVKITDRDARDYYKLNREVFQSEPKARVRVIKLSSGMAVKAQRIVREIRDGAAFAAVARRESTDASKDNGGDLGTKVLSELPDAVASAVRAAKVGGLLGPIVGDDAVWIVQVVSKQPARKQTFSQVKGRIYSILKQEREVKAFNDWIESLKKKAKVRINV